VGRVELAGVAAVDERGTILEELLRPLRGERLEHRGVRQQRAAVQLDDALEVRRLRLELARQPPDELALAEAEKLVVAALEADRRGRLLAHRSAPAERASQVAGPELDVIGELEQAAARAEETVGALVRIDREVGPADRADEERVTGQHEPGIVAAAAVGDDEREVLGPVARRRERADQNVAELELGSVGERLVPVLRAGLVRDVEGRPGGLSEAAVAGDVVGVVVRLEHVREAEVVLVGELEVVLDLPLRVDDGCLAPVRDHVRGAGEILVQHLAEEHLAKPTAFVMSPEELRRASGRHRRRRRDLQRQRRRGDDLREAVDLAGSCAAQHLEPAAGVGEGRAAADGGDLEPGEPKRDL
jgi:hypothetical protein